MSADLGVKIRLGLDELLAIRQMMEPLIARTTEPDLPVIETAAACSMLHSLYTEMEKIFKLIARDFDHWESASESWHRDLLNQMAIATESRPAVVRGSLVVGLRDLLAFRHLFRGASIALMRWNKLAPLMEKASELHDDFANQMTIFLRTLPEA